MSDSWRDTGNRAADDPNRPHRQLAADPAPSDTPDPLLRLPCNCDNDGWYVHGDDCLRGIAWEARAASQKRPQPERSWKVKNSHGEWVESPVASQERPQPNVYLPMDCPVCGRHRVEWDGKILRCEKCTTSSEWEGFTTERYERPPIDVERLAALEHEQWAHWTRYMLDNLTPENIERWERQIATPYSDLSESEKESDREWARKVVRLSGSVGE